MLPRSRQQVEHCEASKTSDQAEPEEQGTTDQEQDGKLYGEPARIAGQDEKEEATEQHVETGAHESAKSMLEGSTG
ncbi:MAG: hypothetical protein E6I93_10005 [Chloroflexi bacterium]|nr:MAG: hypothetical protein E6I93_10005 [Chloroflexota bacterium]